MAELTNKPELADNFRASLEKLNAKQAREFKRLLGDPPDPRNVPASFWSQVRKDYEDDLAAALLLIFLLSYDGHRTWGDIPAPDNNDARDKIGDAWTGKRAETVARGIVDHSREMAETAAKEWKARKEPPTRDEVDDLTDKIFGPSRTKTIAVTETQQAMVEGGEAAVDHAVKTSKIRVTKYWGHTGRRLTGHSGAVNDPCPVCTPREGLPESQWGGQTPGSIHPHCILPGNRIVAFGGVAAMTKALYDGRCVEIRLESGRTLSVTENHPILTLSGWTAAKFINQGDDLLCAPDSDRIASFINPNNNHSPVVIDEMFRSFEMSHFMSSSRVKLSPIDFHGDARFFQGNVNVIWPGSELRRRSNSEIVEKSNQFNLSVGLTRDLFLPCNGLPLFRLNRLNAAANSIVSRNSLSRSLFATHRLPGQQSRLRTSTTSNPVFSKAISRSWLCLFQSPTTTCIRKPLPNIEESESTCLPSVASRHYL